jgi:hypothetical protein
VRERGVGERLEPAQPLGVGDVFGHSCIVLIAHRSLRSLSASA